MQLGDLTPLAGGWSGRTSLAESDGTKVVVRAYDPGGRPEIDAAVLRHAAELGPVPDVLEVRADLWALVELAARRGQNPVADRAHDRLRTIAGARDLHAR